MMHSSLSRRDINIWPGYVDALTALLMVIIFLLLLYTVGQFYLTDALTGKEKTLTKLSNEVTQLANLLALEKTTSADLQHNIGILTAQLAEKSESVETLQSDVASLTELREELENEITKLVSQIKTSDDALLTEKEISAKSLAQIELLNHQVKALRKQLGAVSTALGLELDTDNESVEKLAERLNIALAEKAQELARYRSDFFGRLREVLGENPNIRIVGDRFVLSSELLFDSGSADLGSQGKQQVTKLANTLNTVAANIPDDIDWIVRIDGHTDRRPINNEEFPSNWELSTARALSIVKFMITKDVPEKRLAATGFGQFHPIDTRKTAEAYSTNRRIEIKLTAR